MGEYWVAGRWCCSALVSQWQREAGVILAMHRFSLIGMDAMNKGCAARLNGKLIGLNGFNFIRICVIDYIRILLCLGHDKTNE
jgi:hypothetical protein